MLKLENLTRYSDVSEKTTALVSVEISFPSDAGEDALNSQIEEVLYLTNDARAIIVDFWVIRVNDFSKPEYELKRHPTIPGALLLTYLHEVFEKTGKLKVIGVVDFNPKAGQIVLSNDWFNISEPKMVDEDANVFAKKEFSKRVGYLGGYSLGLTECLNCLGNLQTKDLSAFNRFFSLVARQTPDWLPVEILTNTLESYSKNFRNDDGTPVAPSSFVLDPTSLENIPNLPTFVDLTDRAKIESEDIEIDKVLRPILSGSSCDNPSTKERAIDFAQLFNSKNVSGADVWIGADAVDVPTWIDSFENGITDGKEEAIKYFSRIYIFDVLKTLSESTKKVETTVKDLSKSISKLKTESITEDKIEQISSIAESLADVKGLSQIEIAKSLRKRFSGTLFAPSKIFTVFARKVYAVTISRPGKTSKYYYASAFTDLDRVAGGMSGQAKEVLSIAQKEILPSQLAALADDNENFSFRLDFPYVEEDQLVTLFTGLISSDDQAQMKIESQVQVINPAYVGGICSSYATALTWFRSPALANAEFRQQFDNDVDRTVRKLVLRLAHKVKNSSEISALQAYNVWYSVGLRSLSNFANRVTDEIAMREGAVLIIKVLENRLPEYFPPGRSFSTIAEAISFVETGSIAISRKLENQEKQIADLTSQVFSLQEKLAEKAGELLESKSVIDNQNAIIQDLRDGLDAANAALKKVNEILTLTQENLTLIKSRLTEAEELIVELVKLSKEANKAAVAIKVAAYATAGFLIAGPAGAAIAAFLGEEITTASSWVKGKIGDAAGWVGEKVGC